MPNDQPETLAAVLAEMRAAAKSTDLFNGEEVGEPLIRGTKVEEWADRVEAAAERKQASLEDALSHCRQYAQKIERENEEGETRLDAEEIVATVDNEFAGIRPTPSPGNAAAMRAALERIANLAPEYPARGVDWNALAAEAFLTASSALAAPARNCDRFQTAEEAVAAFADHLRAWENAHGICSEYPDHAVQVPAGAFAWLFDKAEGGDHA